MSPDELLWTAAERNGLTPKEWGVVINHLLAQLGEFLQQDIANDGHVPPSMDRSTGFCVGFWAATTSRSPIASALRGTIGASHIVYGDLKYTAVEGSLYSYVSGHRVQTTLEGHNHILLRYAKIDAADDDWTMDSCRGIGGWRSLGWASDTNGEYEGLDVWKDGPLR